jgi:hypothetical protein
MNRIKYYTKGLLVAIMAIAGLTLTSCKDQPDKYETTDGTPSVDYIRNLSTEIKSSRDAADMHYTNGELVLEASPQSTLALIGNNLRSVVKIMFNDKQAVLNNSYITDNVLIVDVPKGVPAKVTNKIYLYDTNNQVTTVDFKVVIPAPSINTMSCEYAKPGSIAKVIGDYIVTYEDSPVEVYFKNAADQDVAAEILEVDPDNSYVTVRIPEDAVEGSITMKTLYGTSVSAFHYLDSRGILFDFDTPVKGTDFVLGSIKSGWHDFMRVNDDWSLSGTYMQLGDGEAVMSEDGGWDDNHFSFEYWCGSWDTPQVIDRASKDTNIALFYVQDFTKWENLDLKFEMCIPSSNAWKAGAMQIMFQGIDQITISGNPVTGYKEVAKPQAYAFNGEWKGTKDDNGVTYDLSKFGRALYRPWASDKSGSFDTAGEWITVRVPLTDFTYTNTGGAAEKTFSSYKDFASLNFFVVSGGINGKECTPIIKIDNIRVVPNK